MFDDNLNLEKFSLKYSGNVPEDYGISQIQYTFDFINLVLKHDTSIQKAIREVSNEYGLKESFLWDYLTENKYILDSADSEEFSKMIKKFNTKKLKKLLKSHGLKASGKRKKIEKRIFENKLLGSDYRLSSKSKVFYKNKKRRIDIYEEYLFDYYYFNEFNEFYMNSYRKKEINIPAEFINLFINKAVEDKNHEKYISNNHIMAEYFFKNENYGEMLEYVLRIYCMNINPIWKIDELKEHIGIYIDNYGELLFLKEELGKNTVINTFYLVWDSFDFDTIIISKYDAYRFLKDILNYKDLNRLNKDLYARFYSYENLKIKRITQKTLFDF